MLRLGTTVLLFSAFVGCAGLMESATTRLAGNISSAILNQDDLETVRDGAPAYLLMIDGLIEDDPENPRLLLAGSRLYGAYASAFVDDDVRAKRLSSKARGYALRALCRRLPVLCRTVDGPYEGFASALDEVGPSDVPVLYGFASAWAAWVQAHPDDWDAIADIPKIEAAMRRVVALDETYDFGGAHLYLGVLYTLRPAVLGGMPEAARAHFEQAIELSDGRNLMAHVLFAKQYARLVFDRALHDELLGSVLTADPQAPGLTLSNTLAQRQAQELLDGSEDYF